MTVRSFVLRDPPRVSDERLEELRANYAALADNPERKERGYSDLEHLMIMEELQDSRRSLDMLSEWMKSRKS